MANDQVLYRKWRPQKFVDFVGQDHVKQTIVNSIKAGKISHAYLFAGPKGTGKTSMARLLAKAINCLDNKEGEPCGKCNNCKALIAGNMLDLIEIDAASHTGVDDVRDLISKINLAPSVGKYKVYIIDEVHMLSKNAFNALLKTLEEPPSHAIFILATTEVHKLLPTVISRCQYFDFHHLSQDDIVAQLRKIATAEKIAISEDALTVISENSEGSLRDALSILDQVMSLGVEEINVKTLEKILGIVDNTIVRELTQAVLDQDTLKGINLVNDVYYKGYDINQLANRWLSYLRELLMVRLGNQDLVNRSQDEKAKMQEQGQRVEINQLINLLQRIVEAINNYKVASLPQLALEMVIIRCTGEKKKPIQERIKADQPIIATPQVEISVSEIWPKLCRVISSSNPTLGALLKNGKGELSDNKLTIELPNLFSKDTVCRSNNLSVISLKLKELGLENVQIECVVSQQQDKSINEVAEVFDII